MHNSSKTIGKPVSGSMLVTLSYRLCPKEFLYICYSMTEIYQSISKTLMVAGPDSEATKQPSELNPHHNLEY